MTVEFRFALKNLSNICDNLKEFLFSVEQINVYLFSAEIHGAGYAKFKNSFYPEKYF